MSVCFGILLKVSRNFLEINFEYYNENILQAFLAPERSHCIYHFFPEALSLMLRISAIFRFTDQQTSTPFRSFPLERVVILKTFIWSQRNPLYYIPYFVVNVIILLWAFIWYYYTWHMYFDTRYCHYSGSSNRKYCNVIFKIHSVLEETLNTWISFNVSPIRPTIDSNDFCTVPFAIVIKEKSIITVFLILFSIPKREMIFHDVSTNMICFLLKTNSF